MRVFASIVLVAVACGGPPPEPMGPDPSSVGKADPVSKSDADPAKADRAKADADGTNPSTDPKRSRPAPSLTAEQADKVLGRFAALLDEAAKGLTAAKGNCAKVVAVLDDWVAAHASEARAIYAQLGAAQKHKTVIEKYGPRLAGTQKTFAARVAPCSQDPAVDVAAKRFLLALRGRPVPPKSPAPKSPAPKSPAPKSPAPKSPAPKSPAPKSPAAKK